MKNISSLSFTKARQNELSQIIAEVLDVVERHDPQALKIQEYFNMLKAKEPDLKKLAEKEESSKEITSTVTDLNLRRVKLVKAIGQQLESALESSTLRAKAQMVKPLIQAYLKGFRTEVRTVKTEKALQILSIAENAEMVEPLTELGLSVYLTELSEVQQEISSLIKRRNAIWSTRQSLVKVRLINETRKLYRNLVLAIELGVDVNPETDYRPLISELNVVIGGFQSKINSRTTRRQNTIKKETVALSPTTTATA